MIKVLSIMSYHGQSISLGCTTYQQIEVLYFLARTPKSQPFLGKLIYAFCKRNNLYAANEILYLPKVLFCSFTFIGSELQLCHNDIGYETILTTHIVQVPLNLMAASKKCNTNTRIKQVALHSAMSKEFAVLASRMSFTISSAVRLSFQTPTKRLAHLEGFSSAGSALIKEVLNNAIKSSFSLVLSPFSSLQYGDVGIP